jgi:hypothetical protein
MTDAGDLSGENPTVTPGELELVWQRCESVLRENWHEGVRASDGARFAYTSPSAGHYPWQWYWDSCFSAIAWRHFDPERSRRELSSLLASQREDGFIGHTIFWDRPLSGVRRHTYNVLSPDAPTTASIQPPALAWAWALAVGDPAAEPRIGAQHAWLRDHRDLDGDGLIWIVSPDESGLDASPQFDAVWGARAHGLPGYVRLVQRNRQLGYDLRRISQAGGPVCCEVLTNVLYSLSRSALGLPSLTERLIEQLYDPGRGLFLPRARRGAGEELRPGVATIAALAPMALDDLPEEIGHRLAAHLLDEQQFWCPAGPPSVSIAEPSFSTRDRALRGLAPARYWRGPMWMNTAWLCWLGLRRLGYAQRADELAARLVHTIAGAGLREYYNPFTGAGMGARDFAWSTLVLETLGDDRGGVK